MNAFSDTVEAKISDALRRFGQTGAIRRTTVTGGDPWNPDSGTETIVNHACTLVVMDYSVRERESSLVEQGDRKVYVSPQGLEIEPELSDQMVIGTDVLEIADIMPVNPSGTALVYKIQVRS